MSEHHTHEHHAHVSHEHHTKSLQEKLWDSRLIIILLIAIFLLAFGIRGHLLQYQYLFEFDAFYHARLVQDLVTVGHIVNPDPLAYYQEGGAVAQPMSLYHVASAILYKIISFGQAFNKEQFMWSIQFFPVLFGSLIAVLLYFLGKEVFNDKKVSLIMAFVGAVTPAFAYRTMAGAQGDNAFGFLWFVLGFIFFVRAVKTNSLTKSDLLNAALAGVFFGAMALSWNMYLLIPLIVIAYAFFGVAYVAINHPQKEFNLKTNAAFIFCVKIVLAMGIFHIISYAYGADWIGSALSYFEGVTGQPHEVVAIIIGILAIITAAISIFLEVILAKILAATSQDTEKMVRTLFTVGAISVALYLCFFMIIGAFFVEKDIFYRTEGRTTLGSMVGEESVGNNFFGTKYNALIVFPWIALILVPIGLFLFRRQDTHTIIILFFWILITLFMAWYKLKFTFVFGLAIAPAAAIVVYMVLEGLKKFEVPKGLESKILIGALLLLVVFGVGASARFFPDYTPYVDEHPEWIAAQQWIIHNTPTDAKLFNWWDQGHILSFITERKVSTDNRNYSAKANAALAEFVTTTDTNRAYLIAAQEIGADYVVLDASMFSAAPTLEYYVAGKIDQKLVQKYYKGTIRVLNCQDNNATIICEGNAIPRTEWDKIATTWKSTPDDFQNGSDPLFYYHTNDQLIVLNDAMNNTNLVKVWTHSSDTNAYYEEAYSSKGIKILKIKK